MVTVVLAAIDKVIISNAAIYGMKKDTHLTGDEYSSVGSIFYFGYLAFEYPAALLIQRLPVAKLYAGMVLGWAILLLCTAVTQNFAGLATVRFLMGMTEAAVFPISSILTAMW
jgi:Major Facilitator Superfamily.